MRLFLATAFVTALLFTFQPATAADLTRDVQTLSKSVRTLQSQLRAQSRNLARIRSLETRLAKLTNQVNALRNAGGSAGAGSSALDSRIQKLENVVKISGGNVTLQAAGKVAMRGSQAQIDGGSVKINTGVATFSGTVKSSTLITDSVVSKVYTPGAGNIW